MPSMSFARLAELMGGTVLQGGEREFASVVIDSREVKDDAVFFAIRGERLDGHDFLEQALEKARGAVVSRISGPLPENRSIVQVDDTTAALQQLARNLRREWEFQVIGITGSAGKTTTKEMIATLVATERRTWRSLGNFNNHIGLPLSLANTPDDAEMVVSEMGMSAAGEIAFLARIALPDVGVYTNIRPVHLEFFESIDGIAAAKRELLENMKQDGTIVINADDPRVMKISEGFPGRRVTYGTNGDEVDYRAASLRFNGLLGTEFRLEAEGRSEPMHLPLPGRHNLENLLASIAAARVVGISWEGIARGIEQMKPAAHRGVVVPYGDATLYDDTYNSNPYALGRALDLLDAAECTGKRIAVIGDMLELGKDELQFHREVGEAIPRSVDLVVAVGPRALSFLEGARMAGFPDQSLHHFETAEDAVSFLRERIGGGDLVLLKGSRGIGLDRIVAALTEEAG